MEEIARWAAPAFTTIAALMTAANLGSRVTGWGFGVFLAGSVLWTLLGWMTGQPNLVWQNIVLSLLNIFGMWRWLGRQAAIEDGGKSAERRSEEADVETLFPISLLTSAAVCGQAGDTIGRTVEAMAGRRSGRIAYLAVGTGGVAGVGERLHRLDWTDVEVRGDKLLIERPSLEGYRTLEDDHWPVR